MGLVRSRIELYGRTETNKEQVFGYTLNHTLRNACQPASHVWTMVEVALCIVGIGHRIDEPVADECIVLERIGIEQAKEDQE